MNALRKIRDVIYALKRTYGIPGKLIVLSSVTTDYATGRSVVSETYVEIARLVVLPERMYRDFAYDLTYVASNKNFVYGGLYDKSIKIILVDKKDVGTRVITLDDRFIIENERYTVKEVNDTAYEQSYMLRLERLLSQPNEDIVNVGASQSMEAEDAASSS